MRSSDVTNTDVIQEDIMTQVDDGDRDDYSQETFEPEDEIQEHIVIELPPQTSISGSGSLNLFNNPPSIDQAGIDKNKTTAHTASPRR